jgi:copper(I)-binding protein
MRRPALLAALIGPLLALAPAGAAEFQQGPITIEGPWARATAPAQRNGAVYMTLRNAGDSADRLVGVSGGPAEKAELHTSEIDAQGVASMKPVEGVEIPPGGEAVLRPAGDHVMLLDLEAPLKAGTTFPLTLRFEHAGTTEVTVEVPRMRPMAGMSGGHDSH